jgi:hypothetical protein
MSIFAEVRTEESHQYLFVAIDRTSKVPFAELAIAPGNAHGRV